MNNKHIGSDFDAFLREEGLLDVCEKEARRKVSAWIREKRRRTATLHNAAAHEKSPSELRQVMECGGPTPLSHVAASTSRAKVSTVHTKANAAKPRS